MSPDADPVSHDTPESALEAARRELMAAFYAKQEADRHYLDAFAAYERAADTLRRRRNGVEPAADRAMPVDTPLR